MSATSDQPAYVGLESVGSAPYRASALEASSFEDDEGTADVEGERLADVVNEEVNGLDSLPEGWDRESVLEYWEGVGGSWEACVEGMTDEFGEERAKEHCSAMKNEVLRTERWRNRF